MKHHILLDTNGTILKKKNKSFLIVSKNKQRLVGPKKVESITIAAECLMSTSSISLAIENQIPVFCMNRAGKVYAKINSKKHIGPDLLRTKQVLFKWTRQAIDWIVQSLTLKCENQERFIKKNFISHQKLKILAIKSDEYKYALEEIKNGYDGYIDVQNILNLESTFGKFYWKLYRSLLPDSWTMKARNVRPAEDSINATLNYFYGFFYSLVEHAVLINGLSPYQDIMHQQQYNSPVLTFDLIEPFRPYVDEWVLSLFIKRIITMDFYAIKGEAIYLNRLGKKELLPLFFQYIDSDVEWRNQETSIKNHIYRYVEELKQEINKIEIDDLISKL